MDMPTAVAIQCVDVTTPKVPSISGRVVKGSGLTKLMDGPFCAGLRMSMITQLACQRFGTPLLARILRQFGCSRRLVHRMAGNAIDQRRHLAATEIERQRTARVEAAARRRIDRVGDLALDRNALPSGHREVGHGP